jgi:hypothetical protein
VWCEFSQSCPIFQLHHFTYLPAFPRHFHIVSLLRMYIARHVSDLSFTSAFFIESLQLCEGTCGIIGLGTDIKLFYLHCQNGPTHIMTTPCRRSRNHIGVWK